ncbi:MAG: cation:dicarboxylase symporter family transporter [Bacteroidetes bacterium]|nr:cation:dicarboxylase symporter family transporter [Bacteroidota bacterium]
MLESALPEVNRNVFASIRYVLIAFLFISSFKKKKLSLWIFSSMILGVEVGIDFPEFSLEMERFGKIFLRLIKSLVAPLIFATLVVGIAGHSNLKQVGRIGLKSILYFEIVTTLALVIGLLAINISQAGKDVQIEAGKSEKNRAFSLTANDINGSKKLVNLLDSLAQLKSNENNAQLQSTITLMKKDIVNMELNKKDHWVEVFPENFAKSIVENQVLQIVIFSVIFAIGLGMVTNVHHKTRMLNFSESLAEVMFKFTDVVMYVAPLAVFGALASTVAKSGVDVLYNLMKLVGTLYVALLVFVVGVLLPIALLAKISISKFIKAVTEPVTIAFATASSEAALPKALENMEKFGVPKKIVGFVIPTGYSFNLDGTTLYLSLASVFIAQMCGMDLTIGQQISICLVLMLTSKGVAGVRGASFVILAGTVASMGIDPEKASIILAVDALMDMARTSVNVLGNCLASAVIARSEGELVTE